MDWLAVSGVLMGCADQASDDHRIGAGRRTRRAHLLLLQALVLREHEAARLGVEFGFEGVARL